MVEGTAGGFDDETAARIDRQISEHQRLEREEAEKDRERLAASDERVVDALSRKGG